MYTLLGFIALALVGSTLSAESSIQIGNSNLKVETHSIREARSTGDGERGPALAVLTDNTVLLGGGSAGGSIYSWTATDKKLKLLGNLISEKERKRDAKFAITDIAVLSESKYTADLLVSFPRLANKDCVEVVAYRVFLNKKLNKISKQEQWFKSNPCVPISAVQHAAGRIEIIDSKSAYLTIGDLGYKEINNRSKRGDLGSIFLITNSKTTKVSSGHRNPQGIVLFNKQTLLASEHGPRGGDEINIIKKVLTTVGLL